MVSQEFEYVHGAWLYLCHVFGKYPLQNASDMFEEFIKKSAQFFNIIRITEIDPLEKELVFQNNIKEGRLKLLNRNTTCVKKCILYFCRNMAS